MAVMTFGLLALCRTPLLRDIGETVVIGTVAALFARSQWHQQLALLPAASQAKAAHLSSLVVGGQGRAIAAVAGRSTELAALTSFVDGLRGALLTSSVLALVAAGVAFVGLRRTRPTAQELEVPEAAPAARAA